MMRKVSLMLLMQVVTMVSLAQVMLKGKVTDRDNHPLPGANVVLKNTFLGQTTGHDGSFQFERLKPGKYILAVTFVGFDPEETEIDIHKPEEKVIRLSPAVILTEEVLVRATRAQDKMPVAFTNLQREELQKRNIGQDIPYLLSLTPSFVATSDAGTGIGYTGFRVRGTDMNRINVTMNGIPLNDAESHSTFFVDFPDLASSAENVQVQRGAGTSTNGGAAFGASLNLQTLARHPEPYATMKLSAGSFLTRGGTLSLGTGLLGKKFTLDARLSGIRSEGYIDRARSNLKSWFVSPGFYSANTIVKANIFSGWEETYQAWNGVPSVRLENDLEGMKRYGEHGLLTARETAELIASPGRTYNLYTYKNQIDHYKQDHYQFYLSHRFSPATNLNVALHYTSGAGYYEQFRESQKFGNYGLPEPVVNGTEIARTDLIRRKWLDNDFYGAVFFLNYLKNKTDFTWGGGCNRYSGRHYGRIIWGEYLGHVEPDFEWYRNKGEKNDFNTYARLTYGLSAVFNLFADLQYRHINYRIEGTDDDLRNLDQKHSYRFFNPKAGIFFRPTSHHDIYLSFARTNREPNRDNFVDTPPGGILPRFETLNDFESGWNIHSAGFNAGICFYWMKYHDQLVLTGQINDVGAPVMTNVEKSYRAGTELQWSSRLGKNLVWKGNVTLSTNKIMNFTEYVDDWDTGEQKSLALGSTNLAFSPALTGNNQLEWTPGRFSFGLISTYVGKQFIDNTSSSGRMLDPYFISSLRAGCTIKGRIFKEIKVNMTVNNLLNTRYESNAWVYSYFYQGKRFMMDGYFPQAGINLMAGIEISL